MAKRFLAKSGPTFFIVSLARKCDESNFKLLLRKSVRKKVKISVRFQGLEKFHTTKIFIVSLAWKCDETNFKLLLGKKFSELNISVRSGLINLTNKTINKLGHFWPSYRARAKRILVNGQREQKSGLRGRKW